ncbi:MAG: hypothetical protein KAI66_13535 [Lentisphaeria bacterium]|nr:hypothetical protein [Lentisphaeria bacterium]
MSRIHAIVPRFSLVLTALSDRSACNASPAISDGKLFFRSDTSLYRIGAK